MRTRTRMITGVVQLVLLCGSAAVLSACAKESGNLVGPGGSIRSFTIEGAPAFDTLGATRQLTATALFADGTLHNVTADAKWISSNPTVATVTSGGLVAAVAYGKSEITASYRALNATAPVRVLPPGTFILSGSVANARTPRALADATVRVTSPSGTWSTTTGAAGEYALPAAGDVVVRAEKDGFEAQEQRLMVNGDAQLNLQLMPTLPAEAYRMTFTASSSCSLPSEFTRRTYTATISETANALVVKLSGAEFIATEVGANAGFTGVRSGNTVQFRIYDDEWGEYSFIESLLNPARWVAYSGTATGTISADSIVTTFNGRIRVIGYPGEVIVANCQAADHRLEFVR